MHKLPVTGGITHEESDRMDECILPKPDDVIGVIACNQREVFVWWSVKATSLTELEPTVSFTSLVLNLYTESRNGKKAKTSIKVDRLFGHHIFGKLTGGVRVTASLGLQTADGFKHIVGCAPIWLPANRPQDKPAGRSIWCGSPLRQEKIKSKRPHPSLGIDGRIGERAEHLPWETLR